MDHEHTHEEEEHHHHHDHGDTHGLRWEYLLPAVSTLLLLTGLVLDYFIKDLFTSYIRLSFYLLAYLPVGWPVWRNALKTIRHGDLFNEFVLMGIATIGAFLIGEYPESVTVMLFYSVGELFQDAAVSNARGSIKQLLDQRPDEVRVLEGNQIINKKAKDIVPGEIVQLRPGDKLSLDGELISESASFNTAALTGESVPATKHKGEAVYAGMINENQVCEIKITQPYSNSKLSKILSLVQDATSRKAPTELFIRKFARVYTPIVFFCAVAIVITPYFLAQISILPEYIFRDWFYRSLIFLVVSCPCALVISIPLGYFGGIGAGSRNGILFKGSSYLDQMSIVKTVVMDKTGTLTKGVFKVQEVKINEQELLPLLAVLESHSTHPAAKAIVAYAGNISPTLSVEKIEEIAGHGLKGRINGKEILAGNFRLMDKFNIPYDTSLQNIPFTTVAIAVDQKFTGYIIIADELKEDAAQTIKQLQSMGIKTVLLSGDKNAVVSHIAKQLGIVQYFGELMPEDKVTKVQEFQKTKLPLAFVGDGVNDAPVIAVSEIGIAMGGLGSEAAIETADVVIQNDMPSKIVTAIHISKVTKKIVWQNIGFAFGVKLVVLLLGAGGLATMWEAIFADVGVAFLAILNAMRIQRMKF